MGESQEHGRGEPGAGPARRGGDVGAEVEPGGAQVAGVVGGELALESRPWRVRAGTPVELRPRRVAEEVSHHPTDGSQFDLGSYAGGASPASCAAVDMAMAPWRKKRKKEMVSEASQAAIGFGRWSTLGLQT